MIKAEVTAENKPACNTSQDGYIREARRTREYQGRVQVFVVSLVELLVVFLGDLAVVFIEPDAKLFPSSWGVLFLAARGSQRHSDWG